MTFKIDGPLVPRGSTAAPAVQLVARSSAG